MAVQNTIAKLASLITTGKRSNVFSTFAVFAMAMGIMLIVMIKSIEDTELKRVLVYTFIALIAFGAVMYLGLAVFAPDRLHTDYFRLEDKKLDMIGQKGTDILINPVDLTVPTGQLNDGGDNE